MPAQSHIEGVFVVAQDILKVTVNNDLAITKAYGNPASYDVLNVAGEAVEVKSVLPVSGKSTKDIWLQISKPTTGGTYKVQINGSRVHLIDGTLLGSNLISSEYKHNRTKVDAVIQSMPELYDLGNRTVLRGLFEAILISDEEIGGDF